VAHDAHELEPCVTPDLFPPSKVRGQRRSNRPLTALRRLARPERLAYVGDTRPVRAKCLGRRPRRHQRPLLRVSIRRSGGGWRLIRCDVSPKRVPNSAILRRTPSTHGPSPAPKSKRIACKQETRNEGVRGSSPRVGSFECPGNHVVSGVGVVG
jgi:hypothetical protein